MSDLESLTRLFQTARKAITVKRRDNGVSLEDAESFAWRDTASVFGWSPHHSGKIFGSGHARTAAASADAVDFWNCEWHVEGTLLFFRKGSWQRWDLSQRIWRLPVDEINKLIDALDVLPPPSARTQLVHLFMRLETCLSLRYERQGHPLNISQKFGYGEAALRLGWGLHNDVKANYCHGAPARACAASRSHPDPKSIQGHLVGSNLFFESGNWILLRGSGSSVTLEHYIDMEEKFND